MTSTIPLFILKNLIILPGQEIKIDVTNDTSKKVVKASSKNNINEVLVIAPKNSLEQSPSLADLPEVGVIAKVKSKVELTNGSLRVVLRGTQRVKIDKYYQNKQSGIIKCSWEEINLPTLNSSKETAVRRKLLKLVNEYIEGNKTVTNSIISSINETTDLNIITDVVTSFMPLSFEKKLEYMQCINPYKRANNLIDDLTEEISINKIDDEIDRKIHDNLENSQREYILKEKLKEINAELGNTRNEEIENLISRLDSLNLNEKTYNKLLNEIKKYENTSELSPESSLIKNYLETLLELPWNKSSKENDDVKDISNKLNLSHYGLNEIKERIIEYISLKKRNPYLKSPVICLVGPPGIGKTSIAMSIASSLNREFYKISVGGLNDSTELIGSRRTYLGAAPGKIIQAINKCKVNNPIILIDEIDKMVKDYKGDPASTMLEILDETQNMLFTDNYIEEPFNLSNIMFILTANEIENIPKILLDRLEIIELSSYMVYEKVDIAKNYLLKTIMDNYQSDLKINRDVLEYIVNNYTKEPGVRELKRTLEKLVRKVIVYEKDIKSITINLATKYLGKSEENYLPKVRDYGIANILAYTTTGGLVSHVEITKIKGTGKFIITGSVGNVLEESVKVVKTFVESYMGYKMNEYDLHVHFIAASQKKDGPSAGVSIALALISLFEDRIINEEYAFTGELSLKGDILPIGGLKEKLIAAQTGNIKRVYIPRANEKDLEKVPLNIVELLDIKFVSNITEIISELFNR